MILKKRVIIIFSIVIVLLLIPAIAMLFTDEVVWSIGDFLVAAALLLGTGILIEIILRTVTQQKHKIILSVFIIILLLLIWMELAVGIFGSPFAGS